jgi:hypothetical protein
MYIYISIPFACVSKICEVSVTELLALKFQLPPTDHFIVSYHPNFVASELQHFLLLQASLQ